MVNFSVNNSRTVLKRIVSQSLIVGVLGATGIISGWIPSLSVESTPTLVFGTAAYAQANKAEIDTFAQILLIWEQRRRQIVSQIANTIRSKDVPDIACNNNNQPQIAGSLPDSAMPLAQQLCSEYNSTIQKYGMSRARFEELVRELNTNPQFKARVEQILIQLQQRSAR